MSERTSITLKIAGEPKRVEFDLPGGPVQPTPPEPQHTTTCERASTEASEVMIVKTLA